MFYFYYVVDLILGIHIGAIVTVRLLFVTSPQRAVIAWVLFNLQDHLIYFFIIFIILSEYV